MPCCSDLLTVGTIGEISLTVSRTGKAQPGTARATRERWSGSFQRRSWEVHSIQFTCLLSLTVLKARVLFSFYRSSEYFFSDHKCNLHELRESVAISFLWDINLKEYWLRTVLVPELFNSVTIPTSKNRYRDVFGYGNRGESCQNQMFGFVGAAYWTRNSWALCLRSPRDPLWGQPTSVFLPTLCYL